MQDDERARRRARVAEATWLEVTPDHPLAREGVARYVAELGRRFPEGFDAPPPAPEPDAVCVVVVLDGAPLATGTLRPLPDPPAGRERAAEVKRMWVDDAWRGAGLGPALLGRLEELAREHGHDAVLLDTSLTLTEAVAMYDRAGYQRIERYNANPYAEAFFAKPLH